MSGVSALGKNSRQRGADDGIDLRFCNIDSRHATRSALLAHGGACAGRLGVVDGVAGDFLSALAGAGWAQAVAKLLAGAMTVADHLERGDAVLVHCSEGWDRTPQLTSLAQLLLDPAYRTRAGLQVLVEKEWLRFGHQFDKRVQRARRRGRRALARIQS